jgi:hypothetical protein
LKGFIFCVVISDHVLCVLCGICGDYILVQKARNILVVSCGKILEFLVICASDL